MASQTITLASSFTPKLATFNSPTPALLPPPPPRSFSCSSSLPTPSLKASYGGIRVLQPSGDFKCYAFPYGYMDAEKPMLRMWEEIGGVEENQDMESLGNFAVEEHNKTMKTAIKFIGVKYAEMQTVESGVSFKLDIKAKEDDDEKVFKAIVLVGPRVSPKHLEFFKQV